MHRNDPFQIPSFSISSRYAVLSWALIPLFIFLCSCSEDPSDVFKTIPLNHSVETLEVRDAFDIVIHQDTSNRVEVQYTEDGISGITCKVNKNTITINNRHKKKWIPDHGRPKIDIFLEHLSSMHIYAPVNVTNPDTLKFPKLTIVSHYVELGHINLTVDMTRLSFINADTGAGMYRFQGYCKNFRARPRGYAHLDARNLISNNVVLKHNSLGNSMVYATDKLHVTVTRPGKVTYYGNPLQTIIDNPASGEILQGN